MIQLWHCEHARSLRPLWALEELELDYQLTMLPFPPRMLEPSFLEVNPLGTVPFFTDGDVQMTESVAICHYLAERYAVALPAKKELRVASSEPDYGSYLNFMYQSDATLTFPQTLFLRYTFMEPDERKSPQVAADYTKWFFARLKWLKHCLKEHDYVCADRFTMADIAIGYALYLGKRNGFNEHYTPALTDYLNRLAARPAFQRALERS